jgi:hypothetical protein
VAGEIADTVVDLGYSMEYGSSSSANALLCFMGRFWRVEKMNDRQLLGLGRITGVYVECEFIYN